jgi:ABC-type nitrate/sulfonate/bicarbonate transport system ATPase subunit
MYRFTYSTGATLLQIKDVSLAFGPVKYDEQGNIVSAEKLVLYNVNAAIKDIIRPGVTQGQVVGFLGPSGIGKTQLFKIIAGLQPPTAGQVLVNSTGIPVKAGMVGVVSQSYLLFEHRRVLGNLVIAGRRAGLTKAQAKEKAMTYLERFKLADRANHWPCQLSGGQRQRVAILQQMMCSEHFLLMDEPFSGLDVLMLEEVISLIREVASGHDLNTIIVVTHDVTAATAVSDTLWLMGRDRDPQTQEKLPGAHIVETINLIDMGLAWQPDIIETPDFLTTVRDIKKRFREL